MAAPLADATELCIHLQKTVPDSLADLALAGASGAVRAYCGWNLTRETRTFTPVGDGTVLLTLATMELVSVSAIRASGVALDITGLSVLRRGQLILPDGFPAGEQVEVDAVHGYPTTPDVARLVTLTIAARIVNNPDNYKAVAVGTVSRTYDQNLTALDVRLLAPYRLE